MTDPAVPAAPARPAFHLVGPGPVGALASGLAAAALGTLFVPVAASLGHRLAAHASHLLRDGSAQGWAAAVVFLLAEESRLFEYDCCVTRASFASELGCSLPTLRTRVAQLRVALDPLRLDLPGPDDDVDDPVVVEQWHSLRA